MAQSFHLRVQRVQVGLATVSLRIIMLLIVGGLLGMIGLWYMGLLSQTGTPDAALSVQHITLPTRDTIIVDIQNRGSAPLTVAQLQVDAAYWAFTIEPSTPLQPGQQATIQIPYWWVQQESHTLTIVTSSGATFEHLLDASSLNSIR